MAPISQQRRFLNEFLLEEFKDHLPKKALVCDVGKTLTFDYAKAFKEFQYVTVDKDPSKNPSLTLDVEKSTIPLSADGLIFNGVFEQCDDPFSLKRNMLQCLKPGGVILMGLASIGMKPYGKSDKWRLTEDGAKTYCADLKILNFYKLPEYFYVLATKD